MSSPSCPLHAFDISVGQLVDFSITYDRPSLSTHGLPLIVIDTYRKLMRDIEICLNNLVMSWIEERVQGHCCVPSPSTPSSTCSIRHKLWATMVCHPHSRPGTRSLRNVGDSQCLWYTTTFCPSSPCLRLYRPSHTNRSTAPPEPTRAQQHITPPRPKSTPSSNSPTSTYLSSGRILEPSPMSLDPANDSPSNHSQSSSSDKSSTTLEEEVETPVLNPPQSIPLRNPMFDMLDLVDEDPPENRSIGDPNHPNYRPLFPHEPLTRPGDQSYSLVPHRRLGVPSPDEDPETP